ncbi:MAG: ATP synthase subunit I [Psychromonas sp.]
MVDKLAKIGQKAGLRLVSFQLFLVLFITLVLMVFFSTESGFSGFAGGITFVLPNMIFVYMAFAHAGASKAKIVVRGVMGGEAIKIFSTVVLLALFLNFTSLSLTAFYVSFAILVASQWLAPLFFRRQ